MMEREEARRRLLEFLDTIRRPDRPLAGLSDGDHLVDVGLIDSLALLEIVTWLEREMGVDFRAGGLDPGRLASVGSILDLIAERGP